MSLFKQTLLSLVAVAAALALWIVFVPSARPMLDRIGVLGLLGIEPVATAPQGAGGGGFGPRGPAKVVLDGVIQDVLSQRVNASGDGRALCVQTLPPWRVGRFVLRAAGVLEMTAGEATRLGIVPGVRVELADSP